MAHGHRSTLVPPGEGSPGLPPDGIYSHPYYTIKDIVGVIVFLVVFSVIMFFLPEMGGYFLEANNFIPADPLKTKIEKAKAAGGKLTGAENSSALFFRQCKLTNTSANARGKTPPSAAALRAGGCEAPNRAPSGCG